MSNIVTRIASVATKRGNVRISTTERGIKCLVVPGFRPNDEDGFVTIGAVIGKLLGKDIKTNRLYNAIINKLVEMNNKDLPDGVDKVTAKECQDPALRMLLSKLRIKADYILRVAGEVFTKEDGSEGSYAKDWYQLDEDSITFSYGEYKEAYLACDPTPFIGSESDVIEDF